MMYFKPFLIYNNSPIFTQFESYKQFLIVKSQISTINYFTSCFTNKIVVGLVISFFYPCHYEKINRTRRRNHASFMEAEKSFHKRHYPTSTSRISLQYCFYGGPAFGNQRFYNPRSVWKYTSIFAKNIKTRV